MSGSTGESLSVCSDPAGHRAFGAHWLDGQGRRWCVRCDPPAAEPELTFAEWFEGAGSDVAQGRFAADLNSLLAGTAPADVVDRMRDAFEVAA